MRLVRPDVTILEAAVAGEDELSRTLGLAVAEDWHAGIEAVVATRDAYARDSGFGEWATRLFVHGEPEALVGWGGFKGPPKDGVVELGYAIAPSLRGRGLAGAAVEEMLREAWAAPEVSAVIAHTLPEENPSTRVLARAGFARDGDGEDTDVGPVWRWRLDRPRD